MTVHFTSLNDVKEFVGLATLQPYCVEVLDGDHVVNAKSFMEMFTLNLAHDLAINVDTAEHEASFANAARKFLR